MGEFKSFDEILEIIKSNEEVLSKFLKEDDLNEIYETFKQYGYSGTIEDIQNKILRKLHSDSILSEEQLSDIAGGKIDLKKGIASAMSTLALMGTVMPSTGATTTNKARHPEKASSSSEIGTLQKVKYWGNKGVEQVKKVYTKASESKVVKYGLGAAIVFGGGYGVYRLLVGGKPVEAHTREGAQLITALGDLFDYVSKNYYEAFDTDGRALQPCTLKYVEVSGKAVKAWHEFAAKYLGDSIENPNVVAPGWSLVTALNNRLPKIKNTDSEEYKDAQTILGIIRKYSYDIDAKKVAAIAEAQAKKKAQEKEKADQLYDTEILKEVVNGVKEISQKAYNDAVARSGSEDSQKTMEHNTTLSELNEMSRRLDSGDYDIDKLSNGVREVNIFLKEMNEKAQHTGGGRFTNRQRSAYADHQEEINKLIEDMKNVKKNEAQQ